MGKKMGKKLKEKKFQSQKYCQLYSVPWK